MCIKKVLPRIFPRMIHQDDDLLSKGGLSSPPFSDSVPHMWSICDFGVSSSLYRSNKSTVFAAKDLKSLKSYIIKAYSKKAVILDHSQRQIERELRIHASLVHTNIVQLHAWFFDSRSIYMVLEQCSYTLSHLISSKYSTGIPETLGLPMMLQVANAIRYIHSLNVLHRDIKPSNIFLQAHGERYIVKLGDFGCAVHTKPTDLRLSINGTTPYFAPEIVDGIGHSFPADIWSFGITLHEALTSTLPFDGSTPSAIYKAIHDANYTIPDSIKKDHNTTLTLWLLESCLDKQPDRRPSATQLIHKFSSSLFIPQ